MSPNDKLRVFAEFARRMTTDEKAEAFVRDFVSGIARTCPMELLEQLAQCVVDCRRGELRDEAERN